MYKNRARSWINTKENDRWTQLTCAGRRCWTFTRNRITRAGGSKKKKEKSQSVANETLINPIVQHHPHQLLLNRVEQTLILWGSNQPRLPT